MFSKVDVLMFKKKKITLITTLHHMKNLKWIIDLYAKLNTIKLLKEIIGDIGKYFLDMILKEHFTKENR